MFDIGMTELLVIGVVALIVVGPKDLPGMFRTVGRFTGKAKGMAREFQNAMNDAADETGVKDVAKDLKAATSKKGLGLDALDDVASKFEEWDPMSPEAKKTAAQTKASEAKATKVATAKAKAGAAKAAAKTAKSAAKSAANSAVNSAAKPASAKPKAAAKSTASAKLKAAAKSKATAKPKASKPRAAKPKPKTGDKS